MKGEERLRESEQQGLEWSGEGGSKGEGKGPLIDYVRQLLHHDCSRKLAEA